MASGGRGEGFSFLQVTEHAPVSVWIHKLDLDFSLFSSFFGGEHKRGMDLGKIGNVMGCVT